MTKARNVIQALRAGASVLLVAVAIPGLASATTPFDAFTADVTIAGKSLAKFDVNGTFTLGAGTNWIDPLTERVTLQVGTFSTTISAGSFTSDRRGPFKFEGTIGGANLYLSIKPLGGSTFEFEIEGAGADLTGTANPVTVGLTIGDDAGSTTVTAKFGSAP